MWPGLRNGVTVAGARVYKRRVAAHPRRCVVPPMQSAQVHEGGPPERQTKMSTSLSDGTPTRAAIGADTRGITLTAALTLR